MYQYRARVLKVVDGDTVDLEVDLGFYTLTRLRFRLEGLDAPETNSSDPVERSLAVKAKNRLIQLLPIASTCVLASTKTEKYGRWLATIWPGPSVSPTSINEFLLQEGLAKPYTGGPR